MATSIPTNMDLGVVLTSVGVTYMAHHCWAYDRFKCLVPTKKDWFRALLTWMLITSNALLFVWSACFTYLKYKYWYIFIPQVGYMSVPIQMYTPGDLKIAQMLNVFVTVGLWLQVSLNAEEGLYWYHLMRAVRQPRSARSWLNSNFFIAWIVISAVTLGVQMCVMFVNVPDEITRTARVYAGMGLMEVIVALTASIVIVRFPAFLDDVRRSGAGRDVRTRLYSYHETNKLRTFFRILFAICAMILGFDGITTAKRVNYTRWAAESIEQVAYFSYFAAALISITLYLPRTYSAAAGETNVMVGNHNPRGGPDAVSNALMSLLREGGQWDEGDDKRTGTGSAFPKIDGEDEEWSPEGPRNSAIANFISPMHVAPQTNEVPSEIRIHVKQEVVQQSDGGTELTVPSQKWQ